MNIDVTPFPTKQTVRRIARAAVVAALDIAPQFTPFFARLPRRSETIALTFDDGPHPEFTPKVLDALAANCMHATFFLVGNRVEKHPDIVRRISSAGHTIGNHTYTHVRCSQLGLAEFRHQLELTDRAIQNACRTAPQPTFFRPPWGSLTSWQVYHLWRQGRRIALWSVSSDDCATGATSHTVFTSVSRVLPRDIVLLHDASRLAAEVLPSVLHEFRKRGITSVGLTNEVEAPF